MTINIGFIGAGAMGESFVSGLLRTEEYSPQTVHAYDINEKKLRHLEVKYGIKTYTDVRMMVQNCDVIVFAVKPQNIREVLSSLKDDFTEKHLIISIVAGFAIESIYKYVSEKVSVIRAMPNTPCLIRKGVTCMAFSENVNEAQRDIALNIMGSVGHVHIVQEKLLNAVTGLSGSGPAYIFLVIEALCDAGVRAGIPRDIAMDLSLQTMIGSATMADITKTHPAILKDQVVTPDGTTIAALHVLDRAGVRVAFMDAVIAATERSRELGLD